MDLLLDPRVLLRIALRRKWTFLIPAAFIGMIALIIALLLPSIYRSEATILIEEQEVPEDLVPALVTDYVDRRIDTLTRVVLQGENLRSIINRLNLYADDRDRVTSTTLIERMRDDVNIEVISTEVNDVRSGRAGEMTVAFEVSFESGSPDTARVVTNELVSLFLATNREIRRDAATQTTSFFNREREAVEQQIAQIEQELATFQTNNRELLPEEAAFSRQLLANVEQQLQSLERDLRALREREGFLTTQLALTEEFERGNERDLANASPEVQLDRLRAELAMAQARYNPSHPDVVRLQREVRSLESMVGTRAGNQGLLDRETALTVELAALRERYTSDHPDVQRLRNELEGVRDALANGGSGGPADEFQRNPSYVQLSAQLNSVQTEIRAIEGQRVQLEEEREQLQERLAQAPAVEREFTRLQRELENAIADRDILADKETTAKLSGALETEAMGERLVLTEPPTAPTSPERPNRKLILAIGLVLAVGSGGFAVTAAEFLDRSIRAAANLAHILGDTPLVSIPVIVTPRDRRRVWTTRVAVMGGLLAVIVAGIFAVDAMFVPLDVLGYEAQNRVSDWWQRLF